ncbi:hypothetical protein, partial [uncultured Thiodictyon sp.]|uniref:hypothetical protein n=1 Tax=uncultured Thiodictyon sp. TaxID=1846217 RepID=UPI0025EA875A
RTVDQHKDSEYWPPLCCPGCDCRSFEDAHAADPLTKTQRAKAEQIGGYPADGLRRALDAWRS